MTVTLEHLLDDVGILRGASSPAAFIHLGRSPIAGAVLAECRGLVVDLGGTVANDGLAVTLLDTGMARLRRPQVVAFTGNEDQPGARVATVRDMLRLLDSERAAQVAGDVAQAQASALAGTATTAFNVAAVVVRRTRELVGPRPISKDNRSEQ